MAERYHLRWHPSVHDYYGESLYFYLLSSTELSPEWGDGVVRLASASGQRRGVSAYYVFGIYDLLLRMWLRNDDRLAFERTCVEELGCERVDPFVCNTVDYVWAEGFNGNAIKPPGKMIARYSRDLITAAQLDDGDSLAKLSADHLLYDWAGARDFGEHEELGIRFFSMISRDRARPPDPLYKESLEFLRRETIGADQKAVHLSSLFTGIGVTDAIVEGSCSRIDEALAFVLKMTQSLRDDGLTGVSTLVVGRALVEQDDLTLSTDGDDGLLVRRASDTFGLRPDALDLEAQQDIARAFAMLDKSGVLADDQMWRQIEQNLGPLFRACAERDDKWLAMQSWVFTDLERRLGNTFAKWATSFSPTSNIKGELDQAVAETKLPCSSEDLLDPKRQAATLSHYGTVIGWLDKRHGTPLAGSLGEDWRSKFPKVVECRNTLAHGRFHERPWIALAEDMIQVYPLIVRLGELLPDSNPS